jgi:hypothetical protein
MKHAELPVRKIDLLNTRAAEAFEGWPDPATPAQ